MRPRSLLSTRRLAAAALALLAASADAQRAIPRTAAPTPLLLRADQPDRDRASPDPTGGDPSLAHGYGATANGVSLGGDARLSIASARGTALCTGALVGPRTLLTAAHCVTDDRTGAVITPRDGVRARFRGPHGAVDYVSSAVRVAPYWLGFANPLTWGGDDVAVVHLDRAALPWMTRYDLFLGDPVFRAATHVGHGAYGNGTQGAAGLDGRRRWGLNRVDLLASDGVLWSDFDDGSAAHDAWCWAFGGPSSPFCDAGHGAFEASLGGGDSGAPLFVDGRIAGVASFATYFCDDAVTSACEPAAPPLADPRVRDGFGALNGHAWVALNADFIAAQVASIPEPSTVALLGGGLVGLSVVGRRRRL